MCDEGYTEIVIRSDHGERIFVRWPDNPDGPYMLIGMGIATEDDIREGHDGVPCVLAELDEDDWRKLRTALIRHGKAGRPTTPPDFVCTRSGRV